MSDDKTKTDAEDRRSVAGGEPYEVAYFAKKHGLTHDQVHALIKKVGNERTVLDAAAEKMKLDRSSVSPLTS
ncbi:DUF3606 domain-containing protein [Beijerinckia sp. L45]|uniref:DUF3606 domain-containing protein n=1 Tax=Beijerinckia sp. L45 TaxID=1641855 RepID=UPI00131B9D24|nr:DUF3606 domain-containing protein [Beijerinckia sp. L45]